MKKLIVWVSCVYLLIPIAISIGMKFSIFSKALGDANGWLGFWGGYTGSLVGALAAGLIAIFVSRTQIQKQAQLDDLRERELIIIKLKIDKYQEVFKYLNDLNREIIKWSLVITEYRRNEITHEELIKKDSETQNAILELKRLIISMEELQNKVSTITDKEFEIGNIIYEYYTHIGEGKVTKEYENPYQSLSEKFDSLFKHIFNESKKLIK